MNSFSLKSVCLVTAPQWQSLKCSLVTRSDFPWRLGSSPSPRKWSWHVTVLATPAVMTIHRPVLLPLSLPAVTSSSDCWLSEDWPGPAGWKWLKMQQMNFKTLLFLVIARKCSNQILETWGTEGVWEPSLLENLNMTVNQEKFSFHWVKGLGERSLHIFSIRDCSETGWWGLYGTSPEWNPRARAALRKLRTVLWQQ